MKIVIYSLAHKAGGGVTYLKNLLKQFSLVEDDRNYYYIIIRDSLSDLGLDLPSNFRIINPYLPSKNLFFRFLYEQLILPLQLVLYNIDLIFSTSDLACIFTFKPMVISIRNILPYMVKDINLSKLEKLKFKIQKFITYILVKRAKKIIFVSNWSKNVVSKQLKITEGKAKIIYHGIDQSFFQNKLNRTSIGILKNNKQLENYILSISTINPHKNFETLLEAYSKLPEELRKKHKLVISGRKSTPNYFNYLEELVAKLRIQEDVFYLGEIKYEDIPLLYKSSILFVLPSLRETFGHTLVEAMAAEVPILAANTTAIPEILGKAGLLFDPHNTEDLTKKIVEVIVNNNIRKELIKKEKERIKDFSWEKTAQQTLKVFKEVMESNS